MLLLGSLDFVNMFWEFYDKCEKGFYNFTNEINSYKIGDCQFPVEGEILVNNIGNEWIYECGFEKIEVASAGIFC